VKIAELDPAKMAAAGRRLVSMEIVGTVLRLVVICSVLGVSTCEYSDPDLAVLVLKYLSSIGTRLM